MKRIDAERKRRSSEFTDNRWRRVKRLNVEDARNVSKSHKKAMRAHLRSQTAKIKRQGDNKVIGFVFLPDLARNRAGYRPSRHRTE